MGRAEPLGPRSDGLPRVGTDGLDLGGDLGADRGRGVTAELPTVRVSAAGEVVDAAGKVRSAEVDAAGTVRDAAGTVVGSGADYATSGYAQRGGLGPPAYALDQLGGGDPDRRAGPALLGPGQAGADVHLDLARGCTRLFAVWRPRVAAAGLPVTTTLAEATALLDRERGLSFATLRQDQEHLAAAAATLEEALDQQQRETQILAATWQGDGGTAARSHLRAVTGAGASTASAVASLAAACGACADELELAVEDKVCALLALRLELVDGRSPGEVDRIIAAAQDPAAGPQLLEDVGRMLGVPRSPVGQPAPDPPAPGVEQAAQQWLVTVLAPSYDRVVASFVSVCEDTTRSITATYAVLARASGGFDAEAFPRQAREGPGAPPRGRAGPTPLLPPGSGAPGPPPEQLMGADRPAAAPGVPEGPVNPGPTDAAESVAPSPPPAPDEGAVGVRAPWSPHAGILHLADDATGGDDGVGAGARPAAPGADGRSGEHRLEVAADGAPPALPVVDSAAGPGTGVAEPVEVTQDVEPGEVGAPSPTPPLENPGPGAPPPVGSSAGVDSAAGQPPELGAGTETGVPPEDGSRTGTGEATAASVHSMAWPGGWGDAGEGGAELASADGTEDPADHPASDGPRLASADDGPDDAHDPAGGVGSGVPGPGAAGGGAPGGPTTRSSPWVLQEDVLADAAAPWTNLADVLGPVHDRPAGGRR